MNNLTTQSASTSSNEAISMAIKLLTDENIPINIKSVHELSGVNRPTIYFHDEFRPFVRAKAPSKRLKKEKAKPIKSKNNIDKKINKFIKENLTSYSKDLATGEVSIPLVLVLKIIKFFASSGETDARVLIKHMEMLGSFGAVTDLYEKYNK